MFYSLTVIIVVVPLVLLILAVIAFLVLRKKDVPHFTLDFLSRSPTDSDSITKIDSSFLEDPPEDYAAAATFDKQEYEQQEHERIAVENAVIPTYWTNKGVADVSKFAQMVYIDQSDKLEFSILLQQTYRPQCSLDRPCPKTGVFKCSPMLGGCPCNQPDGRPGLPSKYRIRRAIRVEDSSNWARYVAARSKILAQGSRDSCVYPQVFTNSTVEKYPDVFEPLDSNEAYLWHGTSVRSALDIAKRGFDLSRHRCMLLRNYGKGVYLAESCTHADEHAKDEPGGFYDGVYAILLCRVCLGRVHFTQDKVNSDIQRRMVEAGCNSICSDQHPGENPFRDFVVYDQDQIYAEYLLLYSREFPSQAPSNQLSEMPFFTQLPVYWNNVAKDPGKEHFMRKYIVRQKTFDILKSLVEATSSNDPPTLLKVWRVENAKTWEDYVAFKDALRERLSKALDSLEKSGSFSKSVTLSEERRATFQTAKSLDGELGDLKLDIVLGNLAEVDPEQELSFHNLENNLGEHLLWHGTNKQAARAIARTNFQIPPFRGGANGARFGQGIYMAESFDKALGYATNEGGRKYVLLCRVCAGEMHFVSASMQPLAHLECKKLSKDSVLAHPGKTGIREFVALHTDQVYPEFILKFDVTQRMCAIRSCPLPGTPKDSPPMVSSRSEHL